MRRIFQQFFFILALIIIIILAYINKELLKEFLVSIVNYLGFSGIFILAFFLDILFFQPFTPTALLVTVLLLEQFEWYLVFLAVICGSLIGSLVDYYLGKKYGEKILYIFASKQKIEKIEELFQKYSHYAIISGAVTPVPYSLICWFCGMSRIDFKKFIIYLVISRTTLFFVVSLLVKYGFLSFI